MTNKYWEKQSDTRWRTPPNTENEAVMAIQFCSQLGVRQISDYSPARTMDDCPHTHKNNYGSMRCNVKVITGR